MNITQLKYFQAVCVFGSTVKAAEALYVSQPAVSTAIAKLESEYNIVLFNRVNNRLVLTEHGKQFFDKAEQVLKYFDSFNDEMLRLHNTDEVSISIPPVGDLEVLNAVIGFRNSHPHIKLNIYEDGQSEAVSRLQKGSSDFAITIFDRAVIQTYSDFDVINLFDVALKFCINNDSILSQKECITISDVADTPIVIAKDYYYQNNILLDQFMRCKITPNIVLYAEHFSTIKKLIQDGYAAGFLYGSTPKNQENIVRVPLNPQIVSTFGIVYRKAALSNPNMVQALEYLSSCIKR